MLHWNDALEGYWLAKRQNFSRHTEADYTRTFHRFHEWLDTDDVAKITPRHVREFLLYLKEDLGLAAKTVNNSWIALSSFWTWLHAEFELKHIMRKVERPKYNEKPPEPYTENEVKRLINSCYAMKAYSPAHDCYAEGRRPTAARDAAIMILLVSTGLRAAELCDLNIGDYDRERGKITILAGKGNKTRILFIGKTAMHRIWRYLIVRGIEDLRDSEPLFASKNGTRIRTDNLYHLIRRAGERADVSDAGVHRFRHTFAIQFLRNGGSVYELRDMLGHEDLKTSLRYARLAEVDLEAAQRRSNVADAWKL